MTKNKRIVLTLNATLQEKLSQMSEKYGFNCQQMLIHILTKEIENIPRQVGRPLANIKQKELEEQEQEKIKVKNMSDVDFCTYAGGKTTVMYDEDEKKDITYCTLGGGAWLEHTPINDREEIEQTSKKLGYWKH